MFMQVLVLVLAVAAAPALADDFSNSVIAIYGECAQSDGLSPCLKRKAISLVDRLSRMDHLSFFDLIEVNQAADAVLEPAVTEAQLEASLPRALNAKDEILTSMLWDKVGQFVESRSVQFTMPQMADMVEEGRDGGGGGGGGGGGKGGGGKGGGKKGGKKGGGMMKHMGMAIMAKLVALIPIAIAGLFLLAKKALITAKIALVISGIIFVKKLLAKKQGGGGHQEHVHASGGWSSGGGGGGGGGWQSGGGGWDKRSLDEAQKMAYNAYKPE